MMTNYTFIVIFLACLLPFSRSGDVPRVPQSQIEGLYTLYASTNGDYWTWQTNYTQSGIPWNFTTVESEYINNPCVDRWQGITCSTNCTSGITITDNITACNILEVELKNFNMSGTLPSELSLLTQVSSLSFDKNSLYGSIPSALGSIVTLQILNIPDNELDGTLPSELASAADIQVLDFELNQLSGTIPNEYSALVNMTVFIMSFNFGITGTIPAGFGSLTNMQIFTFASSQLTGTVPSSLANMQGCFVFSLRDNLLTGSFPIGLMAMPRLYYMLANDNLLTGSFEGVVVTSPSLMLLRLNNNMFSGSSILPALCYNFGLQEVLLGGNAFSGSIPSCVGNWAGVEALDLSSNRFTGSLPSSLGQITTLVELFLYGNMLTGPVINSISPGSLEAVVIGDNEFTGSLPTHLFDSSSLDTFIASKNCFDGSIPSEVCLATNLQTLAVSGITAASVCTKRLSFGSYMIRPVPGVLPACIFSMPKLTQFFAGGNSIRSKLTNIPPNSVLQNLTLSYNKLYGTIPTSYQKHTKFDTLDLSYNELVGTIELMTNYTLHPSNTADGSSVGVGVGTNVILERNALSGRIPASFTHATTNINILSGNMFECASSSTLPQNDPRAKTYSCGSQLLDFYVYSWLVLFCLLCAAAACYYGLSVYGGISMSSRGRFTIAATVRVIWQFLFYKVDVRSSISEASSSAEQLIRYSSLVLKRFRSFCLAITATILFVFLPTFTLLSNIEEGDNEVQTYQYGWGISMAFLSGVTAGAIVFVLWSIFLLFCIGFEVKFIDRTPLVVENEYVRRQSSSKWRKYIIFVVNVTVTMAANGAYVYVRLTQSFTWQLIASLLLVLYKLCMIYFVLVPWLESVNSKYVVILSVMIVNVIIVPMLATLAADVSCYESLFIHADPITTEYAYPTCDNFGYATFCVSFMWNIVTVSFPVPFVYSDQCYTAVLTNYVPIYVMTYGIIGMLIPIAQILMTICFANATEAEKPWLIRCIKYMKTIEWFPLYYMLPLESVDDMVSSLDKLHRKHFYLSRFNSFNCVLLLTLLVTFGVAYSPLAVMLMVNITFTTLAFQLSIYYHSEQIQALSSECTDAWYKVLVDEIKDMHKIIFGSRTAIYIFSSMFVSFGIFEMVATRDFGLSLTLMILMVVLTAVGANSLKYYRRVNFNRAREIAKMEQLLVEKQQSIESLELTKAIELQEISANSTDTINSKGEAETSADVVNPMITPSNVITTVTDGNNSNVQV